MCGHSLVWLTGGSVLMECKDGRCEPQSRGLFYQFRVEEPYLIFGLRLLWGGWGCIRKKPANLESSGYSATWLRAKDAEA